MGSFTRLVVVWQDFTTENMEATHKEHDQPPSWPFGSINCDTCATENMRITTLFLSFSFSFPFFLFFLFFFTFLFIFPFSIFPFVFYLVSVHPSVWLSALYVCLWFYPSAVCLCPSVCRLIRSVNLHNISSSILNQVATTGQICTPKNSS